MNLVHNLGGPQNWSKKFRRLVDIAKEHAGKSKLQTRHGAILFNNQHIYQRSCNQTGHRIHQYTVPAIHAEAMALRYIRNMRPTRGNRLNILVVRVNNHGHLDDSKPCAMCVHMMKKYNINRVYYTDKNGQLCYIKVNYLDETHITKGLTMFVSLYGTRYNLPVNNLTKKSIFLTKTWNTQKINHNKNK